MYQQGNDNLLHISILSTFSHTNQEVNTEICLAIIL